LLFLAEVAQKRLAAAALSANILLALRFTIPSQLASPS
jgi:hypothetical protein